MEDTSTSFYSEVNVAKENLEDWVSREYSVFSQRRIILLGSLWNKVKLFKPAVVTFYNNTTDYIYIKFLQLSKCFYIHNPPLIFTSIYEERVRMISLTLKIKKEVQKGTVIVAQVLDLESQVLPSSTTLLYVNHFTYGHLHFLICKIIIWLYQAYWMPIRKSVWNHCKVLKGP